MEYTILGALVVVLAGCWAFGYTPKVIWAAVIAKLKSLWANFHV